MAMTRGVKSKLTQVFQPERMKGTKSSAIGHLGSSLPKALDESTQVFLLESQPPL